MRLALNSPSASWLGLVVVAAIVAACSSTEVQRSARVLTEPAVGTTLQLAGFAGHSSCIDFDGTEIVREEVARVEIHAFVEYTGADACTDDWVTETVTVELEEPLGERRLLGCAGTSTPMRTVRRPTMRASELRV